MAQHHHPDWRHLHVGDFSQKLVAEMPAVLDPKLQVLDGKIRSILGVGPANAPAAAPAAPPPARPASK